MYNVCTHIIQMEIKTVMQRTLNQKKKLNETKSMQKKWSLSSVCQLLLGLGSSLQYMS